MTDKTLECTNQTSAQKISSHKEYMGGSPHQRPCPQPPAHHPRPSPALVRRNCQTHHRDLPPCLNKSGDIYQLKVLHVLPFLKYVFVGFYNILQVDR